MTEALQVGAAILKKKKSSLDAVVAVVAFLENCPRFNAGKGAVFNKQGINELDACVMDGKKLRAGAVTNVTNIKNPIKAARLVMEKSKHVFLCSSGAEKFAEKMKLEIVDPIYFKTDHMWKRFQKSNTSFKTTTLLGTVGAVALDKKGNLAAATSTGGLANKMHGRIGDSPIVGAGTYANNKTCAISATGTGELFIRNVVAHDISAMMEYTDLSLEQAAKKVVNKIKKQRGYGGIIGVDKEGNIAMPYHSWGMMRGYITSEGEMKVIIW